MPFILVFLDRSCENTVTWKNTIYCSCKYSFGWSNTKSWEETGSFLLFKIRLKGSVYLITQKLEFDIFDITT